MSTSKPTAFVLMPFAHEFEDIYTRFLQPVLTGNGFDVKRADDIVSQRNILKDVVDGIVNRDLVVADLTGANPNVFYALGIAHSLGKTVILITQNITEVPFDLRQYRILEYSRDFASIEDAKKQLAEYATQFLGGTLLSGDPVSDFLGGPPSRLGSGRAVASDGKGDHVQGYLDHVVYFLEGYETLSESLLKVIPYAEEVEANVTAATGELVAMSEGVNAMNARSIRDRFGRIAVDVGVFVTKLHEANETYSDVTSKTYPSFQFIASVELAITDATYVKAVERLTALQDIQRQFIVYRSQLTNMESQLASCPPIQHQFDRELRRAISEIRTLADNYQKTIHQISEMIAK